MGMDMGMNMMMKRLTNFAPFLLLAAFVTSIFYTGVGTESFLYGPLFVFMIGGLALLHVPHLKTGWAVPKTAVFLFVFLFWLWMLVSNIWSSVPYVSLAFIFILSLLPLGFFALTLAPNPEALLKKLLVLFGSAFVVVAAWVCFQYLFLYEEFGPRIHHPLLNPNSMAALLNMGLILSVGHYLGRGKDQSRLRHIGVIALMALFVAALTVTQSRSAVLIFILCATLLGSVAFYRPLMSRKRVFALLAIVVVVPLAAHFYYLSFYGDLRIDGPHGAPLDPEVFAHTGSIATRMSLWASSLHMFLDHPWTGSGLATFNFDYPSYRAIGDQYSIGGFAHMDPLQFGLEMGVLAPLLFYSILISVLLRTISALRTVSCFDARLRILVPFCAMLTVVLHAHLSFPLYMPVILIPLTCLLAYWYVVTEKYLREAKKPTPTFLLALPQKHNKVFVTLLGALVLLSVVWPVRVTIGQYYLDRTYDYLESETFDRAHAHALLERAVPFVPSNYWTLYEYKAIILTNEIRRDIGRLSPDVARQRYLEALALFDRAQSLNPNYYELDIRKARLNFIAGKAAGGGLDKAIDNLHAAIEKNPSALFIRLRLSHFYQEQGDLKRALDVLEPGLQRMGNLDLSDIPYMRKVAKLRLKLGRMDGYQDFVKQIERKNAYLLKFSTP